MHLKLALLALVLAACATDTTAQPQWLALAPTHFVDLGSPADGTLAFCDDCDSGGVNVVCSSQSIKTGALAFRVRGAWKCVGG